MTGETMRTFRSATLLAALLAPGVLHAQATSGWGRVSLFWQLGRSTSVDTELRRFDDLQATLTLRSATESDGGGFEYALDTRGASASTGGEGRSNRFTLYDAWVGGRAKGGTLSARIGQMWLNDLGALGSVGGVLLETRAKEAWGIGRPRVGAFYGLEPKWFQTGYEAGVKKYGGYLAVDGDAGRRHVVGYVAVKNQGLLERSVVTVSNFIPAGKTFFLYQAAEVDLAGPGGAPAGKGLNYLFGTARWAPHKRFEIQATFHHGRSIDARTITQDQLDGRPVSASALQGLLFESVGGRVTVEVLPGLRLWGGYAREKSNRDEAGTGRLTAGLWAANVLKSGVDVTLSDNRYTQPGGGSYDGWYVSVGRGLGGGAYLSVDYSTALSVVRVADAGGVVVERRPRTRRGSLSGIFNVTRHVSLLLTADRTQDDATVELRGLLGLSYRF